MWFKAVCNFLRKSRRDTSKLHGWWVKQIRGSDGTQVDPSGATVTLGPTLLLGSDQKKAQVFIRFAIAKFDSSLVLSCSSLSPVLVRTGVYQQRNLAKSVMVE